MARYRTKTVTVSAVQLTERCKLGDGPAGAAGDYLVLTDGETRVVPADEFEAKYVELKAPGRPRGGSAKSKKGKEKSD